MSTVRPARDPRPSIASSTAPSALDRLTQTVREEIALLAYPDRPWVAPAAGPDGGTALDVLIVGAGQSGLLTAAALKREGVVRTHLVDAAPPGLEGPWLSFARMHELRSPKITVGSEFGLPNLGLRRWFEARHGCAAWEAVQRVPRTDWAAYLAWYRAVWDLSVENGTRVEDIRPAGALLAVTCRSGAGLRTRYARLVVLATGSDGAGGWRVPDVVADGLPASRYDHANGPIDLARLAGRRVGILGHGASAFDAGVAALEAGAASVDLCFRRARLPRVNPHRAIETAGMMTHYPSLPDSLRWQIARHFRAVDQPPARHSFERATAMPGFRLHAAAPWLAVGMEGDVIRVEIPDATLRFDHVIAATGQAVDLAARPELHSLHARVARWGDRYAPPPGEADARLAQLPYLGPAFEFLPRDPGADAWVGRVHAFSSASTVSHGPHATSIAGHRHALPRLVRGLTRTLFLAQADGILPELRAYCEPDLSIPDDFEDTHGRAPRH
ncbi:FAD/NAD(P)-binding protein [uncultured Methylobacterium sp.]|uniref:FAD/NAD(P)-binding protein n=1 Tax=uncultured Methylobacterium sp. TaxID=157278 RepID=UPI0035CB5B25